MSKPQKVSDLTHLILDSVVENLKEDGIKTNKKKLIDKIIFDNYGHYYKGDK